MAITAQTESRLKTSLDHLKNHVTYPANRKALVEACNNMQDVQEADRKWFNATIPEGTYKGPAEVLTALVNKV